MTASPTEPAVKKSRGISSLCTVSHLVIQPSSRIRHITNVQMFRRALALYLLDVLCSCVMMKSCLAWRKTELISTMRDRAPYAI